MSDESERSARDQLLALLGHELRNPLAPIVAALDVIRLRNGGVIGRELEIIERHVNHLRQLVNDLLDISRLVRGEIHIDRRAVLLEQAVRDAVDACEHLLEARKHSITIDCAPGLRVFADRSRLVQVLTNILANAAKYTPPGGAITIATVQLDGLAEITIRDNGRGISAELMPRLFELFSQQDQGVARTQGGLGLGLAIVKRIVELHGGTVAAASDGENRGTLIMLHWPLGSEEIAVARTRTPARRAQRILVVDDNVDAAETLADVLRLMGHEVVVAHSAVAAIASAQSTVPQVALVDIGMPVMDGYELAQRLRGMPELGRVSLVALTGYGTQLAHERAVDAGFDHHFVKPLDPELLAKLLDE